MTFAFYPNAPQKGVRRSEQKETPLRLIISHRGQKYKKFIGISVLPADFVKQRTKDAEVNKRLNAIEIRLREKLTEFSTPEEIKGAVEYALSEVKPEKETGAGVSGAPKIPTFWEYFTEWADRDTPQKRPRKNTRNLISALMGETADWEGVDTSFYFLLMQKMKEAGYSVNYMGSVVAKLKTVMSEGYKLKYHKNTDYHQFTRITEQPTTVYLTMAEVDALWNLELKDEMERRVRDLFLVGVYSAMRFSDYSRLSKENIRGGYIYFTQKKTAGRVVIPAAPRLVAILKRNGGRAPVVNQTVFNREIKTVCMRAGIHQKVEVTKSKGDRHITEMKPKYTQVSSHTARRTGATLMYQSGVPASQVMAVTGHRSESAFMRYIRTTAEENAKLMKSNAFFR